MGRVKEWAMARQAEQALFSTCCGAHPLGDTHETCGHHMGFCSDCKDHAEFIGEEDQEEPYIPTDAELEEVEKASVVVKAIPVFNVIKEEFDRLIYNAKLKEHDAHEQGDEPAKAYWRGFLDAFEKAREIALSELF